jgi:hypothetical protein
MQMMSPDVGGTVNGAASAANGQSALTAVPRINLGLALPGLEVGLGNGNASSLNGHSTNGHSPNGDSPDGHAHRQTVSVVIPALNEQKNIGWVLDRLPVVVDEVVLVDGYSRDRTVEIARAARPDIVVIRQNGRGKGEALRAGFRAATGDLVVMIDADGSMDPAEIDRFVTPLLHGYDFVKGSRFLTGGGSTDLTPVRRLGSQALVRMTNALFLVRFTDLCYGYCSFRRDCLPALALTAHGFEIETELVVHAVKANLRIAEVPSMELPRRSGMSNLHTFRDGQRVLRTLVRERVARRPRPVVDPIDQRALQDWRVAGDSFAAHAKHEASLNAGIGR